MSCGRGGVGQSGLTLEVLAEPLALLPSESLEDAHGNTARAESGDVCGRVCDNVAAEVERVTMHLVVVIAAAVGVVALVVDIAVLVACSLGEMERCGCAGSQVTEEEVQRLVTFAA